MDKPSAYSATAAHVSAWVGNAGTLVMLLLTGAMIVWIAYWFLRNRTGRTSLFAALPFLAVLLATAVLALSFALRLWHPFGSGGDGSSGFLLAFISILSIICIGSFTRLFPVADSMVLPAGFFYGTVLSMVFVMMPFFILVAFRSFDPRAPSPFDFGRCQSGGNPFTGLLSYYLYYVDIAVDGVSGGLLDALTNGGISCVRLGSAGRTMLLLLALYKALVNLLALVFFVDLRKWVFHAR